MLRFESMKNLQISCKKGMNSIFNVKLRAGACMLEMQEYMYLLCVFCLHLKFEIVINNIV